MKKFPFLINGVFGTSSKYISSSNSSDMYPLIALNAAISGDTKYTLASFVPERPLKLRLIVLNEIPFESGA